MDKIEEDQITEDVEEAATFEVKVNRGLCVIEEYVGKRSKTVKDEFMAGKVGGDLQGVKLPKITIKRFTGETTEWQQFYDTFKATVDANRKISDVEKFSYLKGFIGGAAEKCIEGVTLTAENYKKALDRLEERYGNKQVIIAAHVNKLLKLENIKGGRNVKDLRQLFDQVESHVRSLGTLNVRSEHYGPLLIPIILERLPEDIKLQISRALGQENWEIERFMETLKTEIMARESCTFMKTQSVSDKDSQHFTTEVLMAGSKSLQAVCVLFERSLS